MAKAMSKSKTTVKRQFQKQYNKCRIDAPKMCKLGALKSAIVFCADRIFKQEKWTRKHCDDIVFCDIKSATGIYIIENKGGKPENLNLDDIQQQLQGGAWLIEQNINEKEEFDFMPVLVAKKLENLPPTARWFFMNKYIVIGEKKRVISSIAKNRVLPPI